MDKRETITQDEFFKRIGFDQSDPDFSEKMLALKYRCVRCKTVQCANDLLEAGVKRDEVDGYLGFSCVGRFDESKGCNWTLGGLFAIHNLEIEMEDGHKRAFFDLVDDEKLEA